MKICAQWLAGVLLILWVALAIADAPERVLWDKRPIPVHIKITQERIIHFPDEVRYWLPDNMKHKVSVLAANGVLYIKALEPFSSTRIRVQGLSDQQIYLLDVTADEVSSVSEELIVMTQDSVPNRSKDHTPQSNSEDWRVRLTRYAAQQLYAPERLLKGDHAIKRIPLGLSTSVPLIRGGTIEALPIASWQANGLTVTAVTLRNLTSSPLRLDFQESKLSYVVNLSREVRGNWLTITIQHADLGVAGQKDDTTTLYLVSEQSFVESLNWVASTVEPSEESTDG